MPQLPITLRRRPPPQALRWAERALGRRARVTTIRRLRGGSTSAVHLLRVEGVRGLEWVVLRRFARADWLAQEPDLAVREARVLRALDGHDLPVPRLLAVDEHGDEADVPAVLMTRVPGRTVMAPDDLGSYVRELAAFLPAMREIGPVDGMPSYRPWFRARPFAPPAWSRRPDLWHRANELSLQPPPEFTSTFIHRDYHPANALWRYGRLTGVTDWVNACNGPAGIDVAHCAVNLSALFGVPVAEAFREAYEAVAGEEQHPYWDLLDALDTGPPPSGQWHDVGRHDLDEGLIRQRVEEYLELLVRRLS
ncbi:MAG: aminoglycoside phosphotransferase family protein [Dehalococcoidia bacterium]|nr:aminoglycoside phosphotransferase family protein [Dehalococcoidia bacterium]